MNDKTLVVTVEVDLRVTRRRKIHQVAYPGEDPIHHEQDVGPLLEWLWENDHHEFVVVDGSKQYLISMRVPPWQ